MATSSRDDSGGSGALFLRFVVSVVRPFVLTVLVVWAVTTVIRGAVGLLMVALAVELMARTPEPMDR